MKDQTLSSFTSGGATTVDQSIEDWTPLLDDPPPLDWELEEWGLTEWDPDELSVTPLSVPPLSVPPLPRFTGGQRQLSAVW
jgi:hypothetical protein